MSHSEFLDLKNQQATRKGWPYYTHQLRAL